MRNFEERKAEVLRRSEKRIKERKARRNHILVACIPLVLCITILSVFFRLNVTPDGTADPGDTQVMDAIGNGGFTSLSCPIAKITVSGNDLSLSITEVSDLLLISDKLHSYGARVPSSNGAVSQEAANTGETPEDNALDVEESITELKNAAYTIAMVTHEGVKTEYQLSRNTLKDLTMNQSYTLSQTQVNELLELLGIPHS